MFKRIAALFVSFVAIVTLAGCANNTDSAPMEIRSGVVEQVTDTTIKSNHDQCIGAVVGGLGGLGIGALIGSGTGKAVAMVLGAIGGSVAGYEVQKHYDKPLPAYQIFVRTNTGVLVSVTQAANLGQFTKGQKVYIEGSGADAKVVLQR